MAIDIEVEVDAGPALPFTVSSDAGYQSLIQGPCLLYGWSCIESTGAAVASLKLFTGTEALGFLAMAAGGMAAPMASPRPVYCKGGIQTYLLSGAVDCVVYAAPLC